LYIVYALQFALSHHCIIGVYGCLNKASLIILLLCRRIDPTLYDHIGGEPGCNKKEQKKTESNKLDGEYHYRRISLPKNTLKVYE